MNLPKISSYGNYNSSNYGAHTLLVDMGSFVLYYSYETIVAYSDSQDGLVCSVNVWSNTTAKHLNFIQPNKKNRVSNDVFSTMLENMLHRNLVINND